MIVSFEDHIAAKIKMANNIVGLIRRSVSFLSCELFKKVYIRPHLEYAQVVWSPHLLHIDAIENVQIRATKLIDGFKRLDYSERLRRLDLPTLVYRRKRGEMIEMYKHFKMYDRIIVSSSFTPTIRL